MDVIEPTIRAEIMRRLRAAEAEHAVKILYACESGSRAWGFASPDSDYDVRFIYVHDREWYLGFDVERRRDVIEYPIVDELDCNGWDLRKAAYLFTRTNGALFEWLHSPIRYIEEGPMAEDLRRLAPMAFHDVALCYHYAAMARNNAREYLEQVEVRLKKYFYVLRPLLAIRWIQNGRGIPPVEFERLLDVECSPDLRGEIDELLKLKRETPELGKGPRRPAINAFIEAEFDRHGDRFSGQGRPDIHDSQATRDALNRIFRRALDA